MLPDGKKTPLLFSFRCAWQGIVQASRGRNFRIQSTFAVAAIVLLALFTALDAGGIVPGVGCAPSEWAVVAACIAIVLAGECVNTAVEAVVDLASPEYHELAKVAKDCAAGAVLLASIVSLFIGVALFLPRIISVGMVALGM